MRVPSLTASSDPNPPQRRLRQETRGPAASGKDARTRRLATCEPGRSASMLRGSSMIFISRVLVLASALRCRLIARYSASTWSSFSSILSSCCIPDIQRDDDAMGVRRVKSAWLLMAGICVGTRFQWHPAKAST